MVTERTFVLDGLDGEPIRGDLRFPEDAPAPSTGIVILHGFKGFRRWGFFPHVARELARAGHSVVSFDFSRNGVGPGGEDFDELEAFARNTFTRELEEALYVLSALRGGELPVRAPSRVGLLGHSRGGGIAVLAADEGEVDALVTWAAVATFDRWDEATKEEWRRAGRIHIPNARTGQDMPLDVKLLEDLERNRRRLDVEAAAGRLASGDRAVPWLIVHGTADESVSVEDAKRLYGAAQEGGADDDFVRLALIQDAGHTFGAAHPFKGSGSHLDAAVEITREHFATVLAPDGPGRR